MDSNPGRVKEMTKKIDTCCFLTGCLALLDQGKDCLAQYQDNVMEGDIRSWCRWSGLPVGQHYKVTMRVHCHMSVPEMTLEVASM